MKNTQDTIVHWDISERQSKNISSQLLSWTYVVLPRFQKPHGQNPTFENPLDAWLYLLTRDKDEEIKLTDGLIASDSAIGSGFRRLARLTPQEREKLFKEQEEAGGHASIEDAKFAEGEAKPPGMKVS